MPDTPTVASLPMVNVQIDGVWHQFPKGTRLIEACELAGSYVPRYCYHKKLSSPGNCRMCLIEMGMPRMGPDRKPALGDDGKPEINWMPRPQICCACAPTRLWSRNAAAASWNFSLSITLSIAQSATKRVNAGSRNSASSMAGRT